MIPTAMLEHEGVSYRLVDLCSLLGSDLQRMPYVLRILAENVARCGTGERADIALAALRERATDAAAEAELDVVPGRLLMHDTTSTPALVDIAAMRDAVAEAGGDPSTIVPFLPVDVSIDHSTAVEAYARPDAVEENLAIEMRRNAERFAFLKWAAHAMGSVRLHPPGTGIMHTINLEQLATVITVRDGWPRRGWLGDRWPGSRDGHARVGVLAAAA